MNQTKALKILVVDDEEIVRFTIEKILQHLGHHTHSEGDGLKGLRALEEEEYDAAIVDIRMPGLDGVGFLSRASGIRPGIPVIMVSGHASPDIMEEVLQAGAFSFLAKPFRIKDLDMLMKKIRSLRSPDHTI